MASFAGTTLRVRRREWVASFLRGVDEQARDASRRAKRFQDLQLDWRTRLTGVRSSLPLRLADHLFESPVVTIPQPADVLQVTYHSARRCVEKLVSAGILQPVGETRRGRTFVAGETVDAISDVNP